MKIFIISLLTLFFIGCSEDTASNATSSTSNPTTSATTTPNSNNPTVITTISHNSFSYNVIISPITGKKWLDRNLGASEVCTKSRGTLVTSFEGITYSNYLLTDNAYVASQGNCFGDYYQWGRLTDGHEKRNSGSIMVRAGTITGAGVQFIINGATPYDWLENTTQDSNNVDDSGVLREAQWSKTDGTSICPIGFRVPTSTELFNETISYSGLNNETTGAIKVVDRDTAFKNFLKFPVTGIQNVNSVNVSSRGNYGIVWTSSIIDYRARTLLFQNSPPTSAYINNHAYGIPVRCVKN